MEEKTDVRKANDENRLWVNLEFISITFLCLIIKLHYYVKIDLLDETNQKKTDRSSDRVNKKAWLSQINQSKMPVLLSLECSDHE